MGLQSQLNDVSSDSIPLLVVALIAGCVSHVRSAVLGLVHFLGLSRFGPDPVDDGASGFLGAVGSGLAGLIVLANQLNLNRAYSYPYRSDASCGGGSDCVVCMSTLRTGEQVRKLSCRHVFHKNCFDGWLEHLNFNCPLCRSPLHEANFDESVALTRRRRVGADLVSWFSHR
ncbi:E3 ubiquitin-protein ligase RHA2A-like [Humulus lupulus]|uniref:E3 ubiquitin-protein ligase RHA2A-like n=1 Tax=Humulus lupulus TaxID=3486 RepID=UPI002B40874B|nr:E3 ubiquitin-protein ligase RHA2A-like [Humulus lupulus]